jgi:hypothetical protein
MKDKLHEMERKLRSFLVLKMRYRKEIGGNENAEFAGSKNKCSILEIQKAHFVNQRSLVAVKYCLKIGFH